MAINVNCNRDRYSASGSTKTDFRTECALLFRMWHSQSCIPETLMCTASESWKDRPANLHAARLLLGGPGALLKGNPVRGSAGAPVHCNVDGRQRLYEQLYRKRSGEALKKQVPISAGAQKWHKGPLLEIHGFPERHQMPGKRDSLALSMLRTCITER